MSVTIRAAIPGDGNRLAVLNRFVQDLHVTHRPDYFKPSRLDEVEEWFRQHISSATSAVWIAEENGQAVGYAMAKVMERPENAYCYAVRWCEIDQIVVDPAFQRRGIAAALIRTVVDFAKQNGIDQLELTTWSFNEVAQQAFQSAGFTPKILRMELSSQR